MAKQLKCYRIDKGWASTVKRPIIKARTKQEAIKKWNKTKGKTNKIDKYDLVERIKC